MANLDQKQLTKSANKKLSGVCAGIAEYFDWDPAIVRAVYAVFTVFSAGLGGVILYAILHFVMPEKEA